MKGRTLVMACCMSRGMSIVGLQCWIADYREQHVARWSIHTTIRACNTPPHTWMRKL